MQIFMRVFFHLLYHPFAFTYDLVAAFVSWGQWKNWIEEALPYLEGNRILELGHGPGHLQLALRRRGIYPYGLDESAQMSRIAARRLGSKRQQLMRGLAQHLPIASNSFDSVVSTFPTEYIFDTQTLLSIYRVLRPQGRLVILPVTFPKNRFLKWLYVVTGESPQKISDDLQEKIKIPFEKTGFEAQTKLINTSNSLLLLILAKKP